MDFFDSRKGILEGVCITGGEPTVQVDLPQFIKKIRSIGFLIKLDTAGTNPRMMEQLIQDKLVDYVAMDIKHRWEKYSLVTQIPNIATVNNCQDTLHLIQESGIDHEYRTTIFPQVHTEEDFIEIAKYLLPQERYYLQDTSYEKNYDASISRIKNIDVKKLIKSLQEKFPHLVISGRE